jgi:hypothetical protein
MKPSSRRDRIARSDRVNVYPPIISTHAEVLEKAGADMIE